MIRTKKKAVLLFAAVLMLTAAFCVTAQADAFTDAFGRQVFEGKDGWLFYSGDDTIANYKGTDLYTVSELEDMREHLEIFRNTLASQGCEFVILIAPNKEQLYSMYMPDSYGAPASYTRAQQVTDYLRSYGFRVVYPIEELKEAVEDHPEYDIYYRRDTHWNELGAYIGTRALMDELGVEMPPIEDLLIVPVPHDSPELSRAIGRSLKDTGYALEGYIDESMDSFEEITESIYHSQKGGADERKVLLTGDSFSLALHPYLAQEFNDLTVCFDRDAGVTGLIEAVRPDIYIYEAVERYVYRLNQPDGLEAPYEWTLEAINSLQ